jgi:nitrate reductase cytochrome c-type subunit
VAETEHHLMLEMDWDAFPGTWAAIPIPGPEPEVHLAHTYEGAPPVVPHSTEWAGNCTACHTAGPTTSISPDHLERKNCTQCHVSIATIEHRQFMAMDPAAFQVEWTSPVTAFKQGRRNLSKPPTVVPHEIEGMEDCLDCHSPEDPLGMGTTHPDRASCTQCHINSATDERRKFLTSTLRTLK